jgi:hypothetical protein
VIDEGVNGWLAWVDDAESLAQTRIREVMERSTLGVAAVRAECEEKFPANSIVSFYQAQL